jgi:uncharacterized lipoprotein YmbA
MINKLTRAIVVAVALGQVVSCTSLSSANKSLYALDIAKTTAGQRDASPARPVSLDQPSVWRSQVLQIRRVNISPPYEALSLIYRTRDGTYVKDHYNEWIAPPEELFTTQLVDYLSSSHAFASVVDGRSAAPHRFALETCITSLYGDFRDPQHPKVVLTARIYLLDESSGKHCVAYQNHFDVTSPLAAASASALVRGIGNAYRQLLESVAQDLSPFNKTAPVADAR